jgi:hypothetical protein
MRAFKNGLVALALAGTTGIGGCDQAKSLSEDVCGPCGDIATGQLSISGMTQLDGVFTAVAQLKSATASIKGDFDANIQALGAVYGVAEADANVDTVTAAIQADFDANLDGGIQVVYKPAECHASLSVSVEAEAQCEVQGGCTVEADPGELSVQCQGSCSGSCDAECSGSLSCAVKTPTVACEGECEGSCQLDVAASCNGTCNGTCSGNCSATNADGQCAGTCDGDCQGTCELAARGSCGGTCHGTCYVEQGSAQCTGEFECSGSCSGSCTGSCQGNFEPPSVSADCEASADCHAQASAQAQASLECTPPSLDIDYQWAAGVDATAQAEFIGRLTEFKARAVAILEGFARLKVLVNGEFEGEVVFPCADDPATACSPFVNIAAQVEASGELAVSGDLDIPSGRIACVAPAFEAAGEFLLNAPVDLLVTIDAQASFATSFGFGGA